MKNKRLDAMIARVPEFVNRGGQFPVWVDCFMGRCFYQDIAPTIRTRTDGANMDFIMEEVKIIKEGNYSPSGHNASSIVSTQGIAPAVMENHGTVTAIKEPKVINPLKGQSDNGWHFEQQVYDAEGIARAVKAGEGSGNIPKVIEPISVAMRGRNPDNPSERGESNGNYKQRLEMNESGVANTITSAQKDSMVAEPRVEQVGNIYPDTDTFKNRTMGRVYSNEGLSPTINCCGGGDREPKIVEDWQTVVGNKQLNPFRGSVEGTSPCITSVCGAGGGMTPMLTDADLETTKTKEFIEQVRGHEDVRYRIRKLTPRECFRLMGVDDEDIDKIQASGISNSQQYKCAGNSIVVDVLYHIFRKMFCETDNESDQLTLF